MTQHTALSRQAGYNQRSLQKLGKKQVTFVLDAETMALFELLAEALDCSRTQVLRAGLDALAQKHQIHISDKDKP